jgi:hypothetical protein
MTAQDSTVQHKTAQDNTRQHKTAHDSTRQHMTAQDSTSYATLHLVAQKMHFPSNCGTLSLAPASTFYAFFKTIRA